MPRSLLWLWTEKSVRNGANWFQKPRPGGYCREIPSSPRASSWPKAADGRQERAWKHPRPGCRLPRAEPAGRAEEPAWPTRQHRGGNRLSQWPAAPHGPEGGDEGSHFLEIPPAGPGHSGAWDFASADGAQSPSWGGMRPHPALAFSTTRDPHTADSRVPPAFISGRSRGPAPQLPCPHPRVPSMLCLSLSTDTVPSAA